MSELLLGCGRNQEKRFHLPGTPETWRKLTTLDMNASVSPDVVYDFSKLPLPFDENSFDEIHAYDVLEHVGQQGDWKFFLDQFADFWRILKPEGLLIGTSPHPSSAWAWGDPGHTRVISGEALGFLDQNHYKQIETGSPMTDYRPWYQADFDIAQFTISENLQMLYVLRAIKPSRWGK